MTLAVPVVRSRLSARCGRSHRNDRDDGGDENSPRTFGTVSEYLVIISKSWDAVERAAGLSNEDHFLLPETSTAVYAVPLVG